MQVGVVVVTYNSASFIAACLEGLRDTAAELDMDVYVVVVDNASVDGTADFVESRYTFANVLRSECNLGFGSGVNHGVNILPPDIPILLVNPDAIVNSRGIEQMVARLDDARTGVVGCVTVHPNGSRSISGGPRPTLLKEFISATRIDQLVPRSLVLRASRGLSHSNRATGLRAYLAGIAPDAKDIEVDWVSGSCMLIRRQTWDTLSGFDSRFFLYYEDVDLCLRARAAGWRVVLVGEATCLHDESKSTSKVGKTPLYKSGMRQFFDIHGGAMERLGARVLARRVRI